MRLIKTLFIASIVIISLFFISCEKEEQIVNDQPFTIERVLKMHKENPASVKEYMVQEAMQNEMDKLMFTPPIKMQPKSFDSTFNAVFKLLNAGTLPPANIVQRIQNRIFIATGNITPDIHSISFVLQGSPGIIFPAAFPGVEMNAGSAYIQFPSNSTLYNAVGNRFFFVFFSLTPITLDWADKVICQLYTQSAVGENWITVDRSQSWYFALSEDGYNDYIVYFYPDTLRFIH